MQADPDATSDACGAHGAFRFEGETLCGDCYACRGSCCSAEFGGRGPAPDPAAPDAGLRMDCPGGRGESAPGSAPPGWKNAP